MTTTKKKPFDMMAKVMGIARKEADRHREKYDGEMCFNLHTFIESLESKLQDIVGHERMGTFEISAHDVARFAWCCLALESGDCPSGTVPGYTFRGMPILD